MKDVHCPLQESRRNWFQGPDVRRRETIRTMTTAFRSTLTTLTMWVPFGKKSIPHDGCICTDVPVGQGKKERCKTELTCRSHTGFQTATPWMIDSFNVTVAVLPAAILNMAVISIKCEYPFGKNVCPNWNHSDPLGRIAAQQYFRTVNSELASRYLSTSIVDHQTCCFFTYF